MSDAVFTRTFAAGPRVRLRHARPSDAGGVARLLHSRDTTVDELAVRALLRFDPARRTVLAAFAPFDGVDTLVGIAALDHAPGAEVDTLVVDERLTDGLGELLVRTLHDRSRSLGRHVA